jgi:hypothetical protein
MNFNELFQKMRELDTPMAEELKGGQKNLDVDKDGDIEADDLKDLRAKKEVDEDVVDECGDMPMPSGMMGMRNQEQQDSISANVSMNASGPGGIRDLMNILKNIEHGDEHDLAVDIDSMDDRGPRPLIDVDEAELANSPDPEYAPVGAAFPTGNDMHSKGQEFPKVNGGGNPMTMETLTNRLSSLYEEIKSR